jgi:hypothetical protein
MAPLGRWPRLQVIYGETWGRLPALPQGPQEIFRRLLPARIEGAGLGSGGTSALEDGGFFLSGFPLQEQPGSNIGSCLRHGDGTDTNACHHLETIPQLAGASSGTVLQQWWGDTRSGRQQRHLGL